MGSVEETKLVESRLYTHEGAKLLENRLYNIFAKKIHKKNFCSYLAKRGAILGAVGAGVGALVGLDMVSIDSGLIQTTLDKLVEAKDFLFDPSQSSSEGLLFYGTRAMLTATAAGFILWGLAYRMSDKVRKKEGMIESILTTPHYSHESEIEMYMHRSGNSRRQYKADLMDFLKTFSTWNKKVRIKDAIESDNLRISKRIPDRIFRDEIHQRPTLTELVEWVYGAENVYAQRLNKSKAAQIAFQLPKQLNQRESYFEGYIFESLPNEPKKFIGLEVISSKLSGGKWVIGSISPEKPEWYVLRAARKNKPLAEAIQKEILAPFYYAAPSPEDLKIAVICEGAYPWVRGGVSTALDDVIRSLEAPYFDGKNIFYELVSITAHQSPFKPKLNFDIPGNVHINQPITDYGYTENPTLEKTSKTLSDPLIFSLAFSRGFKRKADRNAEINRTIFDLEKAITSSNFELFFSVADRIYEYFPINELMYSPSAVKAVHEVYHKINDKRKPDFMTYYFQWISLRQPLLRIIKSDKVKADLYYTVITGLGGVYAALAKRQFNAPMVLTEHGVASEDKMVEVANTPKFQLYSEQWKQTLDFYANLTYTWADAVTTLCQSNLDKQLGSGMDPSKKRIIVNGLPLNGCSKGYMTTVSTEPNSYTVGLLGNVQRVKQVEYFIEVAGYLSKTHPYINWQFHVMGRDDLTDKAYVKQIHSLVGRKGLDKILHFSPYEDWREAFQKLDCGVLTSASEVVSKSIMEILSMGKPMIAPDIGGNRELIYGERIDDYGCAGIVVEEFSRQGIVKKTAEAILALYELKNARLNGNTIDASLISGNGFDFLLKQELPVEEVGPKRIIDHFNADVIMPQYASLFREVMKI